jgi:hypothetical protein
MNKDYFKGLAYLFFLLPVVILIILFNYEDMIISVNLSPVLIVIFISIFIYLFNRYKKEINNPINLFFIGWLIPLALSQIKMSYLQTDFSKDTWMLIILSTVAFTIPLLFNQTNIITTLDFSKYKFENIYIYIKRLYILSVIFILLNWIIQGGIPLINGEHIAGHLDFAKGFSYFINLILPLSGLAVLYLGMTKKNKLTCIIFILTPYIFSVLQTQRSAMFMAAYYQITFGYIVLKLKNIDTVKIREFIVKRVFLLLCMFLIFMTLIGNMRLNATSSNYSDNYWAKELSFKGSNTTVAWIYSYYPMNFDNLNKFMNNFNGVYSYGYNVLMPIIGPTQLKFLWNGKTIPYNTLWLGATGTYLMKIFGDGGLVFSAIVIFIFGLIITFVYKKFIKYGDIKWYGVYAILSFGIVYMFFDAGAIFDPTVIIYSLIMYFILKNAEKKKFLE